MQLAPLQPLQHRPDVAGLCVMYKILKQGAPPLRYTPAAVGGHLTHTPPGTPTRGTNNSLFPSPGQRTFFRSFLPRYSRVWNRVVRQTDIFHQAAHSTSSSVSVNAWLMPSRHN
ncbi:hypothetical protein GWK47_034528 [Chionoecetes opilio]|uniref:Uncharacterized protein n=1 Tax=Chionoecetes opilio TaxID=41210 RepID=A0A8J5D0P3_CHIOP|nr:hypothetical protein GWK47_034528 [Chionoecetes opilio]